MRNRKIIVVGAILLVALFVIAIVMNSINDLKNLNKTVSPVSTSASSDESQFVKEGTLLFLGTANDTLANIDIEIADDEAQRELGLMYRHAMKENQGMLFIFDKSDHQVFWMKNTIISLDIIFADEDYKIVTIHKYLEPYSEKQVTSSKNAKYVIEVNAGFCDRNNIKDGDSVYSSALLLKKIPA